MSGEEACLAVTILKDNIVESDEEFSVILTTSNSAVDISQSSATVTILDDDMVTVGWSAETYSFDEDGPLITSICAEITSGDIARPVTVQYSTIDGTAESNAKLI